MPIKEFPPVHQADEEGLIAIGGDLSVESLLLAYRSGIFPWPMHPQFLTWFAPPFRAILKLDDFHISQSLAKDRKKNAFTFTVNKAFSEVISHCAQAKNRRNAQGKPQRGTWITKNIVKAYIDFHQSGYAHSIEAWNGTTLVGGLYGVSIGTMFAGESMFYLEPNASKLAFCFLVDYLKARNVAWIDCQVLNPLTESLGAKEIPREEYMQFLAQALSCKSVAFD